MCILTTWNVFVINIIHLGGAGAGKLSSTEVVSLTGASSGFDLPNAVSYFCVSKINATLAIIAGGDT